MEGRGERECMGGRGKEEGYVWEVGMNLLCMGGRDEAVSECYLAVYDRRRNA